MRISRQGVDETHRGCPRRAPGASRGTARENRGPWRAWEAGCPVRARAEITGKYAGEVREGVRGRTRGGCRRGVCSVTGWSRDNARRRLVAAAGRPPGRGRPEPGGRARKYSYDALKILQRVWAASGGQCGKYLKESMPLLLDLLEGAGELDGEPRHEPGRQGRAGWP